MKLKSLFSALLLISLANTSRGDGIPQGRIALPDSSDIFSIAVEPQHPEFPLYFTALTLRDALPKLKPGTAQIKAGARHIWQSGVIVLKNKEVLFWTTCRNNFLHIRTPTGVNSYIIGDGKDDL
jgi:hypothetical protein